MSDELKPCPHCGSLDFLTNGNPHPKRLACGNDACQIMGIWIDYDTWQSRPLEDALRARAEAAEARLSDTEKRLEDALGEIEHLKDTRQDPYDFIEIWKRRAEIAETRVKELEAENARKVEYLKKLEEKIPGLNVDLAKANLKLAELEAASRWIPVTERLPENLQNVLFLADSGDVYMGTHMKSIRQWAGYGLYWHDDNYSSITHWQPLPHPPKQEKLEI